MKIQRQFCIQICLMIKKILNDVKNICKSKNILLIEDNAIYLGNYTDK